MINVNANLQQLRSEAYRLWGIKPKQVIYNMPLARSRSTKPNFTFQINYADEFESWPRAYAVALPNLETLDRIIVPIKVIKRFDDIEVISPAWYDMPLSLNKRIVDIIGGKQFYRQVGFLKTVANFFLPKKWQWQKKVPVEDYTFQVSLLNEQTFNVKLV